MTVQEAMGLSMGNVVRWDDPARIEFPDDDCSKMDVAMMVMVEDNDGVDAIVRIVWSDGAELECFANELTKIAD